MRRSVAYFHSGAHMEISIIPKIYDTSIVDAELSIETEAAHAAARRLAREKDLLVAVSGAAGLVGAIQVARNTAPGSVWLQFSLTPEANT